MSHSIETINYSQKAWVFGGKQVCTATHPITPNFSGHSRGRKIHLRKDKKLTVCNMRVDQLVPDNDRIWSVVSNGRCKICFNGLPEFAP